MPACEADFVTGRAILEGEPAVAIIIDPRDLGSRDHSLSKAVVYPHDRYLPLSYMIDGTVDESGFFVPKGKQFALDVLMKTLKTDTWSDVRAMLNARDPIVLNEHPMLGKTIVSPGIAIMHKSTADLVSQQAFVDYDLKADVKKAAKILLDAHQQYKNGRDLSFFVITGGHVNSPYETFGGEEIDVPEVSNAFSDNFSSPAYALKRTMGLYFKNAGDGKEKLVETMFSMLSRYQVFLSGLSVIGKKLEPSPFARYDNILETTKFNVGEVIAAIASMPSKPCFGPEYEDEFSEPLEALAEQLKQALSKVEENLAALNVATLKR